MGCCENCVCVADARVRLLSDADRHLDLYLTQRGSVRTFDEWWYFDTNQRLRHRDCRWSGIVDTGSGRYQIAFWWSHQQPPLITIAPLNADDRPLCQHVFVSLESPDPQFDDPQPQAWTITVTDAGSHQLDIAFAGQHLGWPVPLELIPTDHSLDTVTRDEALLLQTYAGPGQPQTWRIVKALDGAGNPYDYTLRLWSGAVVPLSGAASPATVQSTLQAQAVPAFSADCVPGGFDLFGYSETIGDDTSDPAANWSDLTLWLTLHHVATKAIRRKNHQANHIDSTDAAALFDNRARIWIWPTDDTDTRIDHVYRDQTSLISLQPPWWIGSLDAGNNVQPINTAASVWIDKVLTPVVLQNQILRLQASVAVQAEYIRLRLVIGPGFSPVFDATLHGLGWYEYRSTEPPDLIAGGDYTLTFAGFFVQAPGPDGGLPTMFPRPDQQAACPWGSNTFGEPLHRPINQQGQSLNLHRTTFTARLTDFGRPAPAIVDPTVATAYTLIGAGWAGGATQTGTVDDLNGTVLLAGTLESLSVDPDWIVIAEYQAGSIQWLLLNQTPALPDQSPGLAPSQLARDHSPWNPARQLLVLRIDDDFRYYRPQSRPVVSDDPDEVLFEIDDNPPVIPWVDGGLPAVSITSQPDTLTLRVGPALITGHCADCLDRQQVTPQAWTVSGVRVDVATFAADPFNLLRRADAIWAAHESGDPYHRLWILDGIETLTLWELPPAGGPRRPVAIWRNRPLEQPQPSEVDWQPIGLDCEAGHTLTLWLTGQGYDPTRHALSSSVTLTPIGRQCVEGSLVATWDDAIGRWAPIDAELLPDDLGTQHGEQRTLCPGYAGADAGVVWIDAIERWRVFAHSCGVDQLPDLPDDDGTAGEVRRVACVDAEPEPPAVSTCRWISNDGATWEPIDPAPDPACPDGWECREPFRDPDFVGDVENGVCVPVSCLAGSSTWVWLDVTGQWHYQTSTCPDWCDPTEPGYVGTDREVGTGGCWCQNCS